MMTVAVAAGIGLGSTLGGVFGGGLIAQHGWQAVFWLGGLLPFLLLPFLRWGLPARTKEKTADSNARFNAGIRGLFRNGLALGTVLLWAFSFLIFLALYALILWMPTLLLGYGFKPTETSIGTACIGIGGLAGVILLIPLSWRFGGSRVLMFTSLLGAAAVTCLSGVGVERSQLLLTIAAIGMGLQAGAIGQSALAVKLYPAAMRTTGVGCAAAAGRIGSIVGPAIGGMLLSLQMPSSQIVLTACVPILAAALAVGILDFHGRRR
jgi:AAHS family 4-hydroxybenzoate transporter-like MFS transporter